MSRNTLLIILLCCFISITTTVATCAYFIGKHDGIECVYSRAC